MKGTGEPIIVACVEGGGTSFVVAVARVVEKEGVRDSVPEILHQLEVDSSHDRAHDTLKECADFFLKHKPANKGYHALGLATFGPLGLDKNNTSTYGRILATSPKASWRNVDFLTPLKEACEGTIPLAIQVETDVNAPALAEYRLVCDTMSSVAYITVGTGIGVGLCINGKPVHGRMHPEGGHVPVQPLDGDDFPGYSWGEKCPFRGVRTVEGLASSVALTEREQKRRGVDFLPRSFLAELKDDDAVWLHAANAIANLCTSLLLIASVEKIVIGGGIMKRSGLIEKIQKRTIELINGYLDLPVDNMSELITKSSYGDNVGLFGALILAKHAYEEEKSAEVKQKAKDSGFISPFNVGVIHGIVMGAIATYAGVILTRRR